jgi:ABC-type transport system substrate-binding protein
MTKSPFHLSRRGVLKGAGALGAAGLVWPNMAISQDGRVLTVRSYSDLQVLDPAFRLSAPEGDIIREIFPSLVTNAAGDDWTWELYAAEEMTQEDDLTVFFRLKPGITFTDGYGTMTADDVKFSLERVADPENGKPLCGRLGIAAQVEVIDELSGRIHLTEAFAPLWTSTLPTPTCSILSRRAMEDLGGPMTTEPVAQSGRYIMTDWVPRQRTTLVRNPDWVGEPGGFEEIHIVPIEDPSTAELGFEAGDLDSHMDRRQLDPAPAREPARRRRRAGKALAGLCLDGHEQGRAAARQSQRAPRDPARHRPADRGRRRLFRRGRHVDRHHRAGPAGPSRRGALRLRPRPRAGAAGGRRASATCS